MKPQHAIGIDIGGTKIDCVVVDERGQIFAEQRIPTNPQAGQDDLLTRITQAVQGLLEQYPSIGIGIGCPGHVDPQHGVVRRVVNLGWDEVPLVDELRRRLDLPTLPIYLHKDVNAAALGEQFLGVGRDVESFVYLALGTGLGGAAVVNRQLVMGMNAFAMEVGHIVIHPGGRQCACGMQGCIETYVSGLGLQQSLREFLPRFPTSQLKADSSTADMLQAARQADPLGQAIIQTALEALGHIMGMAASLFNPNLMIIGGGLGHAAADLLMPHLEAELSKFVLPEAYQGMAIRLASVERIAIGSACAVFINE
jgi:glucokinase